MADVCIVSPPSSRQKSRRNRNDAATTAAAEKERLKEAEREAEREKERLRELEIKSFREFSTKLPLRKRRPRGSFGPDVSTDLATLDAAMPPASALSPLNHENAFFSQQPQPQQHRSIASKGIAPPIEQVPAARRVPPLDHQSSNASSNASREGQRHHRGGGQIIKGSSSSLTPAHAAEASGTPTYMPHSKRTPPSVGSAGLGLLFPSPTASGGGPADSLGNNALQSKALPHIQAPPSINNKSTSRPPTREQHLMEHTPLSGRGADALPTTGINSRQHAPDEIQSNRHQQVSY